MKRNSLRERKGGLPRRASLSRVAFRKHRCCLSVSVQPSANAVLPPPRLTSNQQINAIFPSPTFSSDFLYYALSAASPRIKSLAGEQAVPLINKAQFSETVLALPELPEQRAIAEALSDVDKLLGGLEQLIVKKRDLKQAAMQRLLVNQSRLPALHGEWEVKTMPDVCWFQEGPGVRNTQFTTSGVKLLNGTNIFRGRIKLDTTERFISEREANGPYAHFLVDCGVRHRLLWNFS